MTLLLRIILRFEAHIAIVCNISTPSFDKSTVEQLRLVYTTPPTVTQAPVSATTIQDNQLSITTPLKTSSTSSNTSTGTPGSAVATTTGTKEKTVMGKDNIMLATTPG